MIIRSMESLLNALWLQAIFLDTYTAHHGQLYYYILCIQIMLTKTIMNDEKEMMGKINAEVSNEQVPFWKLQVLLLYTMMRMCTPRHQFSSAVVNDNQWYLLFTFKTKQTNSMLNRITIKTTEMIASFLGGVVAQVVVTWLDGILEKMREEGRKEIERVVESENEWVGMKGWMNE